MTRADGDGKAEADGGKRRRSGRWPRRGVAVSGSDGDGGSGGGA